MKLLFRKPIVIFFSLYFFAILCWDVLLFLNPDKTTLSNYLFNAGYGLIYFFTGILGIVYAKQLGFKSIFGKAFIFLGGGLISYAIAQFIWVFYNIFLVTEVPFTSIADVFFLLFFPLVFFAFILFFNIFKQSITKRIIVQFMFLVPIVFIFCITILFKFEIFSNLSFWQNVLNNIYPIGDTLLLCFILMILRISGGYFRSTMSLFALAGLVQLVSDFIFTYRDINKIYWNGDIADLSFAVTSFLFLLSFVYFMEKMVDIKS
ncbi:MAG: hypothetical protein WCG28_03045 [bacterium]